jgi:hypothetical protein
VVQHCANGSGHGRRFCGVCLMAHSRGSKFAGIRRRDFPLYSVLVPVGLAIVAALFASASIDYWTIMRFFGSRGLAPAADAWKDPVFSRPLPFYFFDLPFYSQVFGFVFVLAILCALVFWATAREDGNCGCAVGCRRRPM